MAPSGVDCHAPARWLITPLAASPASFQPSKAAMTAGELSFPIPSSSISDHLLRFPLAPDYVHEHDRRVMWPAGCPVAARAGTDHATPAAWLARAPKCAAQSPSSPWPAQAGTHNLAPYELLHPASPPFARPPGRGPRPP